MRKDLCLQGKRHLVSGTMTHASHAHRQHQHDGEPDWAAHAELIDLDAEVMHAYLSDVMAWIGQHAASHAIHRIIDIGAGTGTGALALARQFPEAEVIALDQSPELLARCSAKARAASAAGRIRTIEADLDLAWPDLGPVDLAWASNSVHHLTDPVHGLTAVRAALSPGGLLALAELDTFPRFLPDDLGLGQPGLEDRLHAVMAENAAEEVPHLGSDWTAVLGEAGFAVQARQTFTIDLIPPLPPSAGRFAQAWLGRLRSDLGDRLSQDDVSTLGALLDDEGPHSLLRRGDLTVRATRSAWIARPVS